VQPDDGGISRSMEQGLQGGEANRVGYPGGDGFIGVIFDDKEEVAWPEAGLQALQEGRLVLYIMEGIGHEATERSEGCDRGGACRSSSDEGLEVAEAKLLFFEICF